MLQQTVHVQVDKSWWVLGTSKSLKDTKKKKNLNYKVEKLHVY